MANIWVKLDLFLVLLKVTAGNVFATGLMLILLLQEREKKILNKLIKSNCILFCNQQVASSLTSQTEFNLSAVPTESCPERHQVGDCLNLLSNPTMLDDVFNTLYFPATDKKVCHARLFPLDEQPKQKPFRAVKDAAKEKKKKPTLSRETSLCNTQFDLVLQHNNSAFGQANARHRRSEARLKIKARREKNVMFSAR